MPTLADDGNTNVIDLPEKILLAQAGAGAGNRLHLVNGAAGMAQTAPTHLGNFYAARGHDGGDDQGGLVAHTAGGMLVRLDARNGGKIYHIAGMCHDIGQLGSLGVSHAAQIDGHQQCGHLVIGHVARHITVYGKRQFLAVQRAAVPLFGDDIIHTHKQFS